jgi:hypothetical protein
MFSLLTQQVGQLFKTRIQFFSLSPIPLGHLVGEGLVSSPIAHPVGLSPVPLGHLVGEGLVSSPLLFFVKLFAKQGDSPTVSNVQQSLSLCSSCAMQKKQPHNK